MKRITKQELEVKIQEMNTMESELKNTIINYEDYKSGYADSIYQFIVDYYIFYVACNDETEGLDLIIDYLEDEGDEAWFIQVLKKADNYVIDTDGNKYYDDEYIIGGNYGRYLYHGGNLRAEKLDI